MMYVGIIAGALLVALVFSTVFYSFKSDKPKVIETKRDSCTLELRDQSDKIELEAVERRVFKKAEEVRQIATEQVNTKVIRIGPGSLPIAIVGAAAPAPEPDSQSLEDSDRDPMNETAFLKSISNKVDHVKKLSQDF